jgi:hypothetical protein
VYLLRCEQEGVFKVGGSTDPATRIAWHRSAVRLWCELKLVSVITTNEIGRLEDHLVMRWKPYRLSARRREWFKLPLEEVKLFRSVRAYTWHDLPAIPENTMKNLACFLGKRHLF